MPKTSHMVGPVLNALIFTLIGCIDSNEPTFLRKLRSEYEGDDARHERPLARPRKQQIGGDEDEEPTYVQEESHDTISKAEYDAMMKNADVEKQTSKTVISKVESKDNLHAPTEDAGKSPHEPALSKQQVVAGIGVNTKRRFAKVVGEEDGTEDSQFEGSRPHDEKKSKLKKGKKIKLSFNEESAET